MKFVISINHEQGWTDYTRNSAGTSPTVRHHKSDQIDLLSPGDSEDRVSLHGSEEILFVLDTLKQVRENGFRKPFKEKLADLTISHTTSDGFTIVNRRTPQRHFHFISKASLDFVIETLEHISRIKD